MPVLSEKIEDEKPMPGLEDFVRKFHGDRIQEMEVLRGHLTNKNFDGLRALGHNWKGFCEPYGFLGLGQLAKELEEQAVALDEDGCTQTLEKMDAYLKVKKDFLPKQGS